MIGSGVYSKVRMKLGNISQYESWDQIDSIVFKPIREYANH